MAGDLVDGLAAAQGHLLTGLLAEGAVRGLQPGTYKRDQEEAFSATYDRSPTLTKKKKNLVLQSFNF